MKNRACLIIDNCSDCFHLVRTHYDSDEDGLDTWYCENCGLNTLIMIESGLTVDAELNVEIPNWCPILKFEGCVVNKPKPPRKEDYNLV